MSVLHHQPAHQPLSFLLSLPWTICHSSSLAKSSPVQHLLEPFDVRGDLGVWGDSDEYSIARGNSDGDLDGDSKVTEDSDGNSNVRMEFDVDAYEIGLWWAQFYLEFICSVLQSHIMAITKNK